MNHGIEAQERLGFSILTGNSLACLVTLSNIKINYQSLNLSGSQSTSFVQGVTKSRPAHLQPHDAGLVGALGFGYTHGVS